MLQLVISYLYSGEERRGSFRPSGPSPAGTEAERRFMGDKVLDQHLKLYQTFM